MDAAYANIYRDLYTRHWWWRARERAILRVLRRYAPAQGWRRILDVGCGDGLFFERLREFAPAVEGVEPDARLLSSRPGNIYVGPFDARFRPAQPFDVILLLDVLEHMDDPSCALAHARELLAPGGILVMTVPALMALWTNHDVINHHHLRYDRRSFALLADTAGIDVVHQRYLFQWTCPVKFLQARLDRIAGAKPENPHVPTAVINRMLLVVSLLENWAASYLPIPFGSTLLVVARAGAAQGQEKQALARAAGSAR